MKRNAALTFNTLFLALLLINITGCEKTTTATPTPTPTAREYTVTFDPNRGTLAGAATVKVETGKTVAQPQDPTRARFVFTAWQKADGTAFDFTTIITADITLTAAWSANAGTITYTVTFDPNQGTLAGDAIVNIPENGTLAQPRDPTRARFVFTAWQNPDGTAFDFTTEIITADITLTATWRAFNTVTAVALIANAMDDGYTATYIYTNDAGTATGGTPEITWFISDNPDGSDSTQVAMGMEITYTPMGTDRYKHLAAAVRVRAAEGGYTAAVISATVFPGFSKQATGATRRFTPTRLTHTSVVFNNRMWVIGGNAGANNRLNDVWSSTDGIAWTAIRTTGDANGFPVRSEHTSVVFDNRMWVIGGVNGFRNQYNDVWSSANGSTWTQETNNAGFLARFSHTSVVFDNRIWVIGGFDTQFNRLNDVWSSAEGSAWTEVTAAAGFSARAEHTSVVFNNRIWVIGGEDAMRNTRNDVWSSANGSTWTPVRTNGAMNGFPDREEHASVVFNNRMWVIGGVDSQFNHFNNVWSSADGSTWTQATADAGFPARAEHKSVVFNNRMWVIGGEDVRRNNPNDVWY